LRGRQATAYWAETWWLVGRVLGCGTLQASAQRSLGFAWGLVAAWPAAQASRVTRPHPRPPPACACRSSSPRPLAFAPAARPPVGRRPIRPSGRRPIAPSGRLVHRCRPPRAALGGSTSRRPRAWPPAACLDRWTEVEAAGRGVGAAAGGRRAEAAGAVGCGGPALLRRSGRRPGAPGTRRPASLHARLPWLVALFHWYCSALGHLSGWLRHCEYYNMQR